MHFSFMCVIYISGMENKKKKKKKAASYRFAEYTGHARKMEHLLDWTKGVQRKRNSSIL